MHTCINFQNIHTVYIYGIFSKVYEFTGGMFTELMCGHLSSRAQGSLYSVSTV